MKKYELFRIDMAYDSVHYFYKKEKNDINGNSRFRVWFFDPDGFEVYEKVFTCYEKQLSDVIQNYIDRVSEVLRV